MSRFERATLGLAIFGTIIGIATIVVFYDQFKEMASQTDVLNIAARQSRRDSAEAAKKVERQLHIAGQQAYAATGRECR